MLWLIGASTVVLCVLVGYGAHGGSFHVLWQPFEFLIIIGSSVGALITASSRAILAGMVPGLKTLLQGPKYTKESYISLLSALYSLFRLIKSKGVLVLESHIESPQESSIFQQFPKLLEDKKVLTFLSDYLRLLTVGTDSPTEIEALFDEELQTLHEQMMRVPHMFQQMAEGMPALGIVAAVLGVINTMGSISEPPEVLGHLIGAALVGTFLGVLLSYGFIGPIASGIKTIYTTDLKYFEAIKIGLLAHLHGYPPAISVEFARKNIFDEARPSFYELEEAVSKIPSPT